MQSGCHGSVPSRREKKSSQAERSTASRKSLVSVGGSVAAGPSAGENSSSPQLWGAWSSNLSRIDLIYTDEFKEYQRPARKDGVNQASFAVKKSKYTDHTKLSVTGKMIYGYFEKYEQVSLQLFDKGISYASGFINEIRVRDKNGNERLVNRLDEGQEATLVFDNISLPYGKENPYWIYGKEYGKIVNYIG